MTRYEYELALHRRENDLSTLHAFHLWPHPVLPVKRVNAAGNGVELGTVRQEGGRVHPVVHSVVMHTYELFEALLDDGWVID